MSTVNSQSPKESLSRRAPVLDIKNPSPLPANRLWASQPDECVKFREVQDASGMAAKTPVTVHTFFAQTVKKWPNKPALAYKKNPKEPGFTMVTFSEYYQLVCTAAKAFIQLGLQECRSVGVLGFNALPWFVSNLGAIFAGGIVCGIYTTNSAETCRYVMEDSGCQIVVVENGKQLEKILEVRHQLPALKHIILWTRDADVPHDSGVIMWEDFLDIGRKQSDEQLISRLSAQVPNKCCTLIYTSGTTGNPKGVMLSHDNVTWTAAWITSFYKFDEGVESTISYLPLSHIAAQMCDLYLTMNVGACVYFAQPDALRGSLKDTLVEVRPTVFLGVPRVFEKMQEKMKEVGANMSGLKRSISMWAKSVGYAGSMATLKGESKPWNWFLANSLVFSKAKQALGLDRTKLMVTAAAPITKDTLDFFLSLDMPLYEIYGMSESSGPQTFNKPGKVHLTSVGVCPAGANTKFDKPDKDGNGEVCMYGRHVFMGYLNAADKTQEALDGDGWLHSGDVGRFDEEEFLFITGRIKEIIITAGGENVAPIPVEDRIREALPCISNAMLVGDKRKYICVLLAFKTRVNEETSEPLDELTPAAKSWCKDASGIAFSTVSELKEKNNEKINAAIHAALKKINQQSISRAACVQKFFILPRDFSIPGGELGPTLKPRRPIISKMYHAEIDDLYRDPNAE